MNLTRRLVLTTPIAVLGLSACGGSGPSASSSASASSADGSAAASGTASAAATPVAAPSTLRDGMGASVADGVFPRTVKHFAGSTTISKAPSKVVVLATGQLDDVLGLGIVPVATASATRADLVPAYLTEAFPSQAAALKKVASVGSRKAPDLEAIANLKPDLILLNSTMSAATRKALAAIAPVVVTQGTGVNWKQDLLLVGAALGKQQAAQKRLDAYAQRAKALGAKVDDATTVSFLLSQADRDRIWGTSSFLGSICTDAGLARPSSQQFSKTSKDISDEQLDLADGDWLFYGAEGDDDSKLTKAALWSSLTAVQAKHAVKVDDEMFFLNAGITAAEGVLSQLEKSLLG